MRIVRFDTLGTPDIVGVPADRAKVFCRSRASSAERSVSEVEAFSTSYLAAKVASGKMEDLLAEVRRRWRWYSLGQSGGAGGLTVGLAERAPV